MKIRSPFLNRMVCRIVVWGFKLLYRTCRVQYHFDDPNNTAYVAENDQRFMISIWHDSLFYPLFIRKPPKFVALVGGHRDGDYVTNVLSLLGFDSVRGSSSKGGAGAIVQIQEKCVGMNIGMTPDGPRGPRRQMKQGCAYLSAQTSRPVLATGFHCDRYWRFEGSWTDLTIPKPFSTIYAVASAPIHVPHDPTREQIVEFTRIIQQEMDHANTRAEALAMGRPLPHPEASMPSTSRAA